MLYADDNVDDYYLHQHVEEEKESEHLAQDSLEGDNFEQFRIIAAAAITDME